MRVLKGEAKDGKRTVVEEGRDEVMTEGMKISSNNLVKSLGEEGILLNESERCHVSLFPMMEIVGGIEGGLTVNEDKEMSRALIIAQPKLGDNKKFEDDNYHSKGLMFFEKGEILSLSVNFPLINIRSIIFKNPVGFFNWPQLDNRWVRRNGLGGIDNGMVEIGSDGLLDNGPIFTIKIFELVQLENKLENLNRLGALNEDKYNFNEPGSVGSEE